MNCALGPIRLAYVAVCLLQSETLEELMQPFPAVQQWMQRVRNKVGLEYEAVSQKVLKTTERFVARKERRQKQRQQEGVASSKL